MLPLGHLGWLGTAANSRGGGCPWSLSGGLPRPMPISGSSHHLCLQSRTKISLLEYRSRWGGNGGKAKGVRLANASLQRTETFRQAIW